MTRYSVPSIWSPVSDSEVYDLYRPTIAMLLIADKGQSIVLVEHEKGRAGCFIPPQGGIRMGESLCTALQREVSEELPGVKVLYDSAKCLFDRVNEIPKERHEYSESSKDKYLYWVAATVMDMPKEVRSAEIRRAKRVFTHVELQGWLETGGVRPIKKAMILEAVMHACRLGILGGNFAAQMVA